VTLVRVETTDGVAVVTLDDPERRNVLSMPMVHEIVAAFDAL
jgi:enoyl-CoA hydratase/carnithine racemase